jgi:hypothetical protein
MVRWALHVIVVGLTLTACGSERQPQNVQDRDPQRVEATPTEPIVQETPGEPMTAAEKTGTGSSGKLLAGILQGERLELPFARNRGVFSIRDDCLIVTVAGEDYTPVLSSAAKRTRAGFSLNAGSFELNREYVLEGGPVSSSQPGVVVPDAVRKRCKTAYYGIGDMSLD